MGLGFPSDGTSVDRYEDLGVLGAPNRFPNFLDLDVYCIVLYGSKSYVQAE